MSSNRPPPPPPPPSSGPESAPRLLKKAKRQIPSDSADGLPTAADLYVRSLPGLPSNQSTVSLYAGNLPATTPTKPIPLASDSDAHLYFLLATNRHIPNRHRLLIWLNGGPGCSSFDGAMMEVGPVRVNEDLSLRVVQNTAWNEYANVLFLDQPAGTGFSYVTKHDDVRELAEAADQVVIFLSNLYKVFPEFLSMDTYIAGESYAGQYIPYIATAILSTTLVSTPLKGLLIGNGWISPRHQYPAYVDYLVDRQLIDKDSREHGLMKDSLKKCLETLDGMDAKTDHSSVGMVLVAQCEDLLGVASSVTMRDGLCMNSYNTTQWHKCGSEWPEQLAQVTPYLRRPDVVKALHAPVRSKWEQCSPTVGSHFWTYHSAPSVLLLPGLLEQDIPILLFNGENDLMCAGTGIEKMIDELEWDGEEGFGEAEAQEWIVDSKLVGSWRTNRGLTYVNFLNASHMVPIDAPVAAHDMLLRFMQVDTLHAAGAAARVPSHIGKETNTVIGATSPDGSTLPEAVSTPDPLTKDVTEDGFDKDHEMLFGPRRTGALVLLLLLVGVGVWGFFRWRGEARKKRWRRSKGKGKAPSSLRSGNGGIRLEEERKPRHHGVVPQVRITEPEEERRGKQQQRQQQQKGEKEGGYGGLPHSASESTIFDVGSDEDGEGYLDEGSEDDEERMGDLGRAAKGTNPWT